MPNQKPKKKLTTQNIVDAAVKDCFQQVDENLKELFKRVNQQRFIKSESVSTFVSTPATFTKIPGLEVTVDSIGKPVRIFLNQSAERVVGTIAGFTGGYVWVAGGSSNAMLAAFAVQRNGAPVHGNLLGGGTAYTAGTATPEASCFNAYYSPAAALDFTDLEPPIGRNRYEVYGYIATSPGQLILADLELVALEHL